MNNQKNTSRTIISYFAALAAGLLVYGGGLCVPLPQPVGLAFRYDATYIVLLSVVLFFGAFYLRGWKGEVASLMVTLALFALPLGGMWSSSVRDSYILGSLLPTGDATRFYLDASRLVEGWVFDSSGWRPLYPAFLSGLLWLTGQNLQWTVALQGALVALSAYFWGRELQRTHGPAAAAIAMTLLFLYARRFSGTTMTENLGVALGAVGLALLWRSAARRSLRLACAGGLVTALALLARPGSLLVLPLLVAWAAWQWRGEKRISWQAGAAMLCVLLLAYGLNSGLASILVGGAERQSNFDLTIYGQVVGGKGWNQVHEDFPEVRSLPEPQHTQKVYELAWEAFQEHPERLLQGALKSWGAFLSTSQEGIFGFVGKENSLTTLPLRLVLYALSLLGLYSLAAMFIHRDGGKVEPDRPYALLTLVLLAGVLLSVPFVPPWDGPGMRLYAASVPFFAGMAGLGAAWLFSRLPLTLEMPLAPTPAGALPGFCMLLCLLVLLPALSLRLFYHSAVAPTPISCPQGMEAIYVRALPGSSIHIVADGDVPQTRLPNIRQSEFTRSNHSFGYTEVADELDRLQVPVVIQNAMELSGGQTVWFISARDETPSRGVLGVCGHWSDGVGLGQWFFYAEHIVSLEEGE